MTAKKSISKSSVFFILLLLVGIIAGAILNSYSKNIRSKANTNKYYDAFKFSEVKDNGEEQPVSCSGKQCTVDSVKLKIKIENLEDLAVE